MESKIGLNKRTISDSSTCSIDWTNKTIVFPKSRSDTIYLETLIHCRKDALDLHCTTLELVYVSRNQINYLSLTFNDRIISAKVYDLINLYLLSNIQENCKTTQKNDFKIVDGFLHTGQSGSIFLDLVTHFEIIGETFKMYSDKGIIQQYVNANKDALTDLNTLVKEYFKNKKLVAIFKDVQKNNPMLSLADTWKLASETVNLLSDNNLLIHY